MNRHIKVDGSHNVRDLGGYPTDDGHFTKPRVLIRAGNLDKVSPAAQQQLIDYGVKTIIDLRDEWEVERYPNVFAHSVIVKYLHLPLISIRVSQDETWRAETETYNSLHEIYGQYLDGCQAQVGAIMSAIIENPPTTIFHCYAGKDRTGIIAALILASVGVSESAIADDYAQSASHLTHLAKQWRESALQNGQDMERFERHIASDSQTMIDTLNHIRRRYGSVALYLQTCGITDRQINRLKERFTR